MKNVLTNLVKKSAEKKTRSALCCQVGINKKGSFLISIHIALHAFQHEGFKKVKKQVLFSSLIPHLFRLLSAGVASSLASSGGGLVLERALGVGVEVLEGVLALVLALLGTAGNALVVGVGGGCTGLGAGLALGVGGLAALVGGGHDCGVVVGEVWSWFRC